MRALADRSRNKAAVSPLFSASHDRNSKAWPFNSYIHFPKQSCMKRKWYTIFVVAAGCIALALGFILFRLKYGGWKELEIELMKDLIQLSLIIIAGGVLVHESTLDRDDQKKLYELKKELYFSMTASYFKVKKIRRILEAGVKNKNRPADRKMSYATYATLMLELNDAQLEYEAHREQLSFFINSGGFSNKEFGEELKENVRVIEKNLNEIVTMYQDSEPETSEVNVSGIESWYMVT